MVFIVYLYNIFSLLQGNKVPESRNGRIRRTLIEFSLSRLVYHLYKIRLLTLLHSPPPTQWPNWYIRDSMFCRISNFSIISSDCYCSNTLLRRSYNLYIFSHSLIHSFTISSFILTVILPFIYPYLRLSKYIAS